MSKNNMHGEDEIKNENIETTEKSENIEKTDGNTKRIGINSQEAVLKEEAPKEEPAKEEAPRNEAEEKTGDKRRDEEEYSAAEGTDASLLSEFAPKPINIPNVDLEKEKKNQEKRRQKRDKEVKKVEARKNKGTKKKSKGKKIAVGIAGFLLFVLLTGTMTGLIGVLAMQVSTSKLAVSAAVRGMDVQEIPLGRIRNYDELGLVRSSSNAALIDIIRDNSDVNVTYREIKSALKSSGMEEFIAENIKSATDYLLKGSDYVGVTGKDIAKLIEENETLVRNLTNRNLTKEDYTAIENHFEQDGNLEEISRETLDKTALGKYTHITRHAMSLTTLGALLLLALALIIATCVVCGKSAYIPSGWAFIISGILIVLCAIFVPLTFSVSAPMLSSVINSYFSFFRTAVIVTGAVFTFAGAVVFLVGSVTSERDD